MKKYLTDLLKEYNIEYTETQDIVFLNGIHFCCFKDFMIAKMRVDCTLIEMDINTIKIQSCGSRVCMDMSFKVDKSNNSLFTFVDKKLKT